MPGTQPIIGYEQIYTGTVRRDNVDYQTPNNSLIRKIISGASISMQYTGADAGTGDVTIGVSTEDIQDIVESFGYPTLLYDYIVFNSGSTTINLYPIGNIPSTYVTLKVLVSLRTNRSATFEAIKLRVNGDNTTGTYDSYLMFHNFDSNFNDEATVTGSIPNILYADGSTAPANNFAGYEITFNDYASTIKNKIGQSRGGQQTVRNVNSLFIYDGVFLWHPASPAAITKLELITANGGNFVSGSRASLWAYK